MLDYLIVGFGLSGLSFVEQLETHDRSYKIYEDSSQKSSRVAGGLYNPVILKRFTMAWQASEQLQTAVSFYKKIENKLGKELVKELKVLRRFNSVEEQNTWFEACDRPVLSDFLSPKLLENSNPALDIPFQYGKVRHTGKINIGLLLSLYEEYLIEKDALEKEQFDYDQLDLQKDYVEYKGEKYKRVLFSEGFGVKQNPFFREIPLYGNKGEYIIIRSEKLKLRDAVKSSIFIIPLGDDVYKVGATYNNQDTSLESTAAAKEQLQKKLEQFIQVPYQIIDQVAGIRPTVRDRRPIVGTHQKYNNMHILNGLGSRGILIGPTVAQKLYDYIENNIPLDKEINIARFKNL